METIKKSFFFFCFFVTCACSKIEIDVKNDNFNTSNGVLYKNDKSYTGSIKTIQDTGIIIVEQFRYGKKNGVAKTFYSNGAPRSLNSTTRALTAYETLAPVNCGTTTPHCAPP